MQAPIVDDELWTPIEQLLPRPALNGILFVLRTGMRWNYLSTELGFGLGATCWRRLNAWQKAGVWNNLNRLLLDKLRESGQLDLSYSGVDFSSVRAVGRAKNWAEPYGSRATGSQTSRSRRRERHAC